MSRPAELYACLFAKEFPAQAMLRLRPELREKPFVVMEGEPPLQTVCSCNVKARRLGIAHGMTRVEVETFPVVTMLPRSHKEEAAADTALLEAAGTFSPRVEHCSQGGAFVCVVDIAGTGMLFGPPAALAKSLQERVKALGIIASVAVSGNFHTAVCVAKARFYRREVTVIVPGTEHASLAPLPISILNLFEEHAEIFSLWGIQTLGMLAALPENALTARLGQEGRRLRQLARGELPHLFTPIEPAFTLKEHLELDSPIALLQSLLLAVDVLMEHLIARATARILALASVTMVLALEGGAVHTRTIRPALPNNDRQLWIKLIHLDLEAHPYQADILAITVTAEPGTTSKVQLGLFSPQLPEPGRLDVTLARIRAIVGEDCVGRAALKDTHRSEGFRLEPFTLPSTSPSEADAKAPRAAMRQLRPAESITVKLSDRRPETLFFRKRRFAVEHAYGPWLTSGDWWNPTLWSFQQWDLIARSEDGALLSCCALHELAQESWQMVGLYD
jgi:protein ImuB